MRSKLRAHFLGMVTLTTMSLVGLLVLFFYTQDIRERTTSGEVHEGMWGPFELERQLVLFRSLVDQIRLGEQVDLAYYQERRGVALSRIVGIHHLAQDNVTFDEEQLTLVRQLDKSVAEFKAIPDDIVPSGAATEQILVLLDTMIEDSHDLLNLRRQVENHARDSAARSVNTLTRVLSTNIVILVCVGVGFYWLALKEARATEQAHRQLQAYADQAEELATTRERARLAREIHDGLGHHLTAIHMQLNSALTLLNLDPDRAQKILEQVEYRTQEALVDVRQSVNALRVIPTDKPSLVEAFSHLVDECSTSGVPTRFRMIGTPRVLSSEVEDVLYRVAQEALTNVRKHAQAAQVDVTLDYDPEQTITLLVQDDGKGAWVREDGSGVVGAHGFGLQGIRERIEHLNGVVRFYSQSRQGFTVEVEVPV